MRSMKPPARGCAEAFVVAESSLNMEGWLEEARTVFVTEESSAPSSALQVSPLLAAPPLDETTCCTVGCSLLKAEMRQGVAHSG